MRKIKPKSYDNGLAAPSKEARSKKVYPTIRFDLEHVPEAKDMKVGDKYSMRVHGKVAGVSQSRFQNDAEFEVHKMELCNEEERPSAENEGEEGNHRDMEEEDSDKENE